MNDSEHIDEVLDALRKVWKRHPEQRLVQLIHNSCKIQYPSLDGDDFYYFHDDEVVLLAENFADHLSQLDHD